MILVTDLNSSIYSFMPIYMVKFAAHLKHVSLKKTLSHIMKLQFRFQTFCLSASYTGLVNAEASENTARLLKYMHVVIGIADIREANEYHI